MKRFLSVFFSIFLVVLLILPTMAVSAASSPALVILPKPSDYPASIPVYQDFNKYCMFKYPSNALPSYLQNKYGIMLLSDRSYCKDNGIGSGMTVVGAGYRNYYWNGTAWVFDSGVDYNSAANANYAYPATWGSVYKCTFDIQGVYSYTGASFVIPTANYHYTDTDGQPSIQWNQVGFSNQLTLKVYNSLNTLYFEKTGFSNGINSVYRTEYNGGEGLGYSGLNTAKLFDGTTEVATVSWYNDMTLGGTPVYTPGTSDANYYVRFLLPGRDGFADVTNYWTFWLDYRVPFDAASQSTTDLHFVVSGLDNGQVTVNKVNAVMDGYVTGTLQVEGYPHVHDTLTPITVTLHTPYGATFTAVRQIIAYSDFVDNNNDGLDDRTGTDDQDVHDWTSSQIDNSGAGGSTFNIFDPNTWLNPIKDIFNMISSSFAPISSFFGSVFGWLPQQVTTFILFAFALGLILRLFGR